MFRAGSKIRVIGHRGAAGAAPENTIVSIKRAVFAGSHAVEIDVHVSADGHLVVIHDPTVDRTTDGSGAVEKMRLPEIQALDAGYSFTPDLGRSFPFRGTGVTIPMLDEAVDAAGTLPMVVEVKSAGAGVALAAWLRARRESAGDTGRFIVGGFERRHVIPAAAEAEARCATRAELVPFILLAKLGVPGPLPEDIDAVMLPIRKGPLRLVTPRFVRRAHARGLGVYVWTIDRPPVMRRLLDIGVDGLISNVPARVRRILAERLAERRAEGADLLPR